MLLLESPWRTWARDRMQQVRCHTDDVKQLRDPLRKEAFPQLVVAAVRVGDEDESLQSGERNDRRQQLPPRARIVKDVDAVRCQNDVEGCRDA